MTAPETHLLRRTAQAALELLQAGLPEQLSLDEPVAVRLPDEDAVWYAAVCGPPEDEPRIHIARGPLGLRYLRDLADLRAPDAACVRNVELLEVAYVPLHALAPVKRGALQKAGVLLSAKELAPDLSAKGRNRSRTVPDKRDLRRLEALLCALLRYEAECPFEPEPGRLATVIVSDAAGGERAPAAQFAMEVHADDVGRTEAPVRLTEETELWPILDARWVLGVEVLPDVDGHRSVGTLLFILDADDGRTIHLAFPRLGDAASLAREFVRGLWAENLEPGFAAEILVLHDELAAILDDVLAPRGVRVAAAESHPAMETARARMYAAVEEREPGDDLASWRAAAKAVDDELGRRTSEGTDPGTVFREFFGPWRPKLASPEDEAVMGAALRTLNEWVGYSRRRGPRARTIAERMLDEPRDERERAILAAHASASPSIYVVRATDPDAESLEIEDVFSGERVTANDRSLSRSAPPGVVLPLCVVPAGPFRMLWLAGPHFTSHDLADALAEIERCGVPPTAEGIATRPEVLGRLWPWVWERMQNPVPRHVTNADGDDLLFHEAVYALPDGEAARRALLRRKDLEYDQHDDAFTWMRSTQRGEEAWGDNIVLGRVRFVGDELLADVNSARRFQQLRAWLDRVPGVAFRSVTTADRAAVTARQTPPDDRLPDAQPFVVPPEALEALGKYIDEHWRLWPDVPVPMFGGATPRQACATPEGRAKVAAFIRTLTSPHPSYDIAPVRARLLRELGL